MNIFNRAKDTLTKLNSLTSCSAMLFLLGFNSVKAQTQDYTDPTQISGQMIIFGDVDINSFAISPDGARVVYVADQIIDGVRELFSVPIDGSATPVRLNPSLVSGGAVLNFIISEDSNRVVYRADQNIDGVAELFSVPIDGSSAAGRLSSNLVSGGNVNSYRISEDSSRVVYQADQITDGVNELFSAPIDGTATAIRLNNNLNADERTRGFFISSDSNRVIYTEGEQSGFGNELFSVPIDGSGVSVRLSPEFINSSDGGVFRFLISPDSSRVVYEGSHNGFDTLDVFSMPIAGGTPIRLNPALSDGTFVQDSLISPDSSRVIYITDQITDGVNELFSVPIAGGTSMRLNPNLSSPNSNVASFRIGADSNQVIYSADQVTDGFSELFRVPIDGSTTAVRLNSGSATNNFTISADGRQVVYTRGAITMNQIIVELFSIPTDGSATAPVRLSADFPSGGRVLEFSISPDDNRVIYHADQNTDEIFELFSVPITGGALERLNDDLPFGSNVQRFLVSSTGEVVYFADQDVFDEDELFSVQLIEEEDDELCFPIVAGNGRVAVVCL